MGKKTFVAVLVLLTIIAGVAIKNITYEFWVLRAINTFIERTSNHGYPNYYGSKASHEIVLILDFVVLAISATIAFFVVRLNIFLKHDENYKKLKAEKEREKAKSEQDKIKADIEALQAEIEEKKKRINN